MLHEELRAAIEAAPRDRLSELSSALWKGFAGGAVSESEAEELSLLIEARKVVPGSSTQKCVQLRKPAGSRPRTDASKGGGALPHLRMPVGSRPRTSESLERRRRWAASGRMPPQIASRFTLAEQAVLAVVALEASKRGDCRLALDHIASLAGVCRATVRNALRQARLLGLITVEERRQSRWRNLPNLV